MLTIEFKLCSFNFVFLQLLGRHARYEAGHGVVPTRKELEVIASILGRSSSLGEDGLLIVLTNEISHTWDTEDRERRVGKRVIRRAGTSFIDLDIRVNRGFFKRRRRG